MKKIFAMLLAGAMVLGMAATAFAADAVEVEISVGGSLDVDSTPEENSITVGEAEMNAVLGNGGNTAADTGSATGTGARVSATEDGGTTPPAAKKAAVSDGENVAMLALLASVVAGQI